MAQLILGKRYKINFDISDHLSFEYILVKIYSSGNIVDYEFEDVQDGQKMYVYQDAIRHMIITEVE